MSVSNFKPKLIKMPLSLAGIALGISSLGSLSEVISSDFTKDIVGYNDINNNIFQTICMFFAFIVLILMIIRIFLSIDNFKKELHDPLLCSFLPSIPICGTILSGFIASIPNFHNNLLEPTVNAATIIGAILWVASILFHIFILFFFFRFNFSRKNFSENNVYASWFIPPVSLIVSSIVSFNFPEQILPIILFQIIWYFGLVVFIIFLPYIFYKMVFADNIPKDKIPTIAILAAPSSITLLGFVNVFTDDGQPINGYNESFIVSVTLLLVMLSFSSWLFLVLALFKIFQTKFNTFYSSLALPSTISPLAMFETHVFFRSCGTIEAISNLFLAIALIETVFAVIMMSYLSIRFFTSVSKWIKIDPILKS